MKRNWTQWLFGSHRTSSEAVMSSPASIGIQVVFLDDSTQYFKIEKKKKGAILLELVFNHLELNEKHIFGLTTKESILGNDSTCWIDENKSLGKQLRNKSSSLLTLYFRVKFYVLDPSDLKDEFSRYHLYLQVKKDILEGRIRGISSAMLCLLASYVSQSSLGDYDHHISKSNNPLQDFKKLLGMEIAEIEHQDSSLTLSHCIEAPDDFDRRVFDLHKLHKGQTPAEAENNFLEHAKRLETYGIFFHHGTDSNGKEIALGVCCYGLVVFLRGIKIQSFSWSQIVKISFQRKRFLIQLRDESDGHSSSVLSFTLFSYDSCKNLWKSSVDHHSFFTHFYSTEKRLFVPTTTNAPKRFLMTLSSRFRYSARTQRPKSIKNPTSSLSRSPSHKYARRTLPLNLESSLGRIPKLASPETSSIGSSVHSHSVPKSKCSLIVKPLNNHKESESDSVPIRSLESFHHRVTSLSNKLPKKAWDDKKDNSDDEVLCDSNYKNTILLGGFISTQIPSGDDPVVLSSNGDVITEQQQLQPSFFETSHDTYSCENGLVSILIIPDEIGRYGFNVKGGLDQKSPIIVSRVGPNTPADKCYPKLNEGDQVVYINGIDVSNSTHDQVVNFIRASSEHHLPQLVLAVKQNAYIGENVEEPEFQYVPETSSEFLSGTHALSQSLLLLEESLESGAIIGQFEQLYRRNANLSINDCSKGENVIKNRYRDILPYDSTRVLINNYENGDYINANHVVMTIPGSGIINRYIATQGPLSSTSVDFWHMIWEVQSTLVIMLTTLVERGRVKCHKYWPNLNETLNLSTGLSISCVKEEFRHTHFHIIRDFSVSYHGEERSISQMAYLSWPDHGVPESPEEFIDFVETVRQYRQASIYPTVVHCSAGIGRTGVLILMETAIHLIEANQPVYPLDLTRVMRDQRASMIQTSTQYKFVCQAILNIYKEGRVKQLPEFCD